jgi:hypothetical protein
MILGRPVSLWVALVAAVLNCAVIVFNVNLTGEQVGAINAFALVVIGIIANQNVTGTMLGRGPKGWNG